MDRIAVFGNAAGGKTTLSLALGRALGIPVHHVDAIADKPPWLGAPGDRTRQAHDELLAADRWIIDGLGSWEMLRRRLDAADTLIFVDHPLHAHAWWAVKRRVRALLSGRSGKSPDSQPPPLAATLRRIARTDRRVRPRLAEMVEARRADTDVVHIRSARVLKRLVRTLRRRAFPA